MYVYITIYSVRKREIHVDYYKNMDGHMWIAIQSQGQVAKKDQKTSKEKKDKRLQKKKKVKGKKRNSCQTIVFNY